MRYVLMCLTLVAGCSRPYEDCLEQQKTEYRERYPTASYGQVQGRQRDFELICSKFKGK
jgi:hypothetical protein